MRINTKIWVVIINYRGAQDTIDCIKSIDNQTVVPSVVVVDNASPDDSFLTLQKSLFGRTNITLLRANDNDGFAAGNNIGIKYALKKNAEYILLLNNDTITDPQLIESFLRNTSPDTAISPRINYYSKKNTIWYAGGRIEHLTARAKHIGQNQIDTYNNNTSPVPTDFLTGCCIWLPVSVIMNVGFMDEDYFMYIEDVDFSLKLKEHGIKLVFLPEALIWHKVGASSGTGSKFTEYYGNRNRILLLRKHHFPASAWFFTLFSRFLLFVRGIILNNNQKIIGLALFDAARDFRGKRNNL